MSKLSIFYDFSTPKDPLTFSEILEFIKNGKWKLEINNIRDHIKKGRLEPASKLKKSLPGFTPSGVFSPSRLTHNLVEYSGLVHLDFDAIDDIELPKLVSAVQDCVFTHACFVSPSGQGLKVFILVEGNKENHTEVVVEVQKYYKKVTGVLPDLQCKDIARLCFISYDTNAYYNPNSNFFKMLLDGKKSKITELKRELEKHCIYEKGKRNEFVFKLGVNSYNSKIKLDDFIKFCVTSFPDLGKTEIYKTAKSAYSGKYIETSESKAKSKVDSPKSAEDYLNSKYDFRYNVVQGITEFVDKGGENYRKIYDYEFNDLKRELISQKIQVSKETLTMILKSSFSQKYDPFHAYFNSLPDWDGVDHINELCNTLKSKNTNRARLYVKRWLIAMVASLIDRGIVNQSVFVLCGKQGVGKTTWFNRLIPKILNDYTYFGVINAKDKDSLISLSECFLICMDELESLNRNGLELLKEVVTKPVIRIRRPYATQAEKLERRASFCASVNSTQLLHDTTGSRRFLILEVDDIHLDESINLEQLYSQAFVCFLEGEKYWFDYEEIELINQVNSEYEVISAEEELLLQFFKVPDENEDFSCLSSSEIIRELNDHTKMRLYPSAMGKFLTKHKFERVSQNNSYKYKVMRVK